jgi:hypothetical protein
VTTPDVRTLKIKTSLAQQMAQPGGRTLADVERRANERLARHKGEAMQAVAATVTELERICAARPEAAEAEVYRLASQLLDLAGFFDTGPLYDAGYSLAETADRMAASGAWTWPSVEVHVRALRLILAADCKADATSAQLLAGLRAVALKARREE